MRRLESPEYYRSGCFYKLFKVLYRSIQRRRVPLLAYSWLYIIYTFLPYAFYFCHGLLMCLTHSESCEPCKILSVVFSREQMFFRCINFMATSKLGMFELSGNGSAVWDMNSYFYFISSFYKLLNLSKEKVMTLEPISYWDCDDRTCFISHRNYLKPFK